MSQNDNTIFGIDLGTTYSCIAYVDEHGKPVVVANQENQRITPSVVFFDGDNIVVGDIAKESAKLYPNSVVQFIKRSMGDPHFEFEHQSKVYRPEEISSHILRKLAQDAEQNLGWPVKDVVITCPAYFGINQREATRLAGEIAELNVRAIINEPTAAAVNYGMAEGDNEKVVLVYDLGGGTFDITMIAISKESIEVICTGGDHNLGGKDWDDCIIRYLAAYMEAETGVPENDILDDPETRQDLILSAEKAKKTLSQRAKAPIAITHGGDRVKVELTREKFEELTSHLLEKTIALTRDMLEEAAKKNYKYFDEILLVGGSTRMPQVEVAVRAAFKQEPKSFDPDEAVAKGAAQYGWKLSINDDLIRRIAVATGKSEAEVRENPLDQVPEKIFDRAAEEVASAHGFTVGAVKTSTRIIIDVCSKSFGIVAIGKDDVERVFNLIVKNTSVPVDVSQQFGTHENDQASVELRIMENEMTDQVIDQENAVQIGMAVLEMPPKTPAGAPLDINFKLNNEGRLEMTAVERQKGRQVKAVIETNCVISGEALKEAKARSKGLVVT